MLESTTDPADWQLEVERVLPQLRITIRNDSKDWRAHLEDMRRYQSDIDRAYGDAKTQLTRLHAELGRALDKISSREKYMNSQLETLLSQYKMVQVSRLENQWVLDCKCFVTDQIVVSYPRIFMMM